MRLVHLTTQFPWPATSGGPVRTLSQLGVLASLPEIERITLISLTEHPIADAACRALADAVPKLTVVAPVFHPIHLWRHPRYVPRVLALRMLGVPYLVGKWDSRALRDTLCRALHDRAVDVVYIDHLGMARFLPNIRRARPRARVILEQHNVESDIFRQFAERRARRLVAHAEWRAAARFETRTLETVDAVVAISQADADSFHRLARVRAHVVPVVIPCIRQMRPPPDRPRLCYVGNLSWHPNVAGLDWFCQQVWPRVRARLPEATVEIAGVGLSRDPKGAFIVPRAWRVPGVETIGFLENLEPLYARSLGMIAPVLGGGGIRIKVLEGFRVGLPIVTTRDGAAGLSLTDGREALIASEPDAFAERVVRLACDEGTRIRLREQAYAYLERHHSPDVAQHALRAALGLSDAV